MGKQQSEDTKAISSIIEENGELLRNIGSRDSQGHKVSHDSINEVSNALAEIKGVVAALCEAESSRVQTLRDTPPPVNNDIKELRKVRVHHADDSEY
jgi:gas vesicle protein